MDGVLNRQDWFVNGRNRASMAKRLSEAQRQSVLEMLSAGHDRDTIAAQVGITPAQVSAISAHVTMGTYGLGPSPAGPTVEPGSPAEAGGDGPEGGSLSSALPDRQERLPGQSTIRPIVVGTDAESEEEVFWNPDPSQGAANPHVLILGESGFGKTYSLCCLLTELARQGVSSIVFDYAQGFSRESSPEQFVEVTDPVELDAARRGVNINPFQSFPFDLHGPVSVAQRIADTFSRVYPGIGVQQHSILRQAAVEVLNDEFQRGSQNLPPFGRLQEKLESYAASPGHPQRRLAATVASHISTVFVFNTFRSDGRDFAWSDMLQSDGRVFIIKLRGLEQSLEKVVTEFLLWNFVGFVESLGPGPLRCFIVLDEAHKLSFDAGSPAEKLLREGRKFGLGLLLASQQPEDFSPVAFANTATKMVFQVGDDCGSVSRQLSRKVRNAHSFAAIYDVVTKLPREWAYVVTENYGRVTHVMSMEERMERWRR